MMDAPEASVLIIEDHSDIRHLLRTVLSRDNYQVFEASSGKEGLKVFFDKRPDAIILDIGLPDLDGWQVLERVRELSDVPVLMLTAYGAEADKIKGFSAGADDYVVKPFSNAELSARLRAIRRRAPQEMPHLSVYDDGITRVNFEEHTVFVDGSEATLTPMEYRLVSAFVQHPNRVLSPKELVQIVWGDENGNRPERVKYVVLRLRKKLDWNDEDGDSPLETVRGFGYRYRTQNAS